MLRAARQLQQGGGHRRLLRAGHHNLASRTWPRARLRHGLVQVCGKASCKATAVRRAAGTAYGLSAGHHDLASRTSTTWPRVRLRHGLVQVYDMCVCHQEEDHGLRRQEGGRTGARHEVGLAVHHAGPKPRRGGVPIKPRPRCRELTNHDRRPLVGLAMRSAPASASSRRTVTTRSYERSSYNWGKGCCAHEDTHLI